MFELILIECSKKVLLKSLTVDCDIRNLLISCKSEFIYENNESEDGEAQFSFPIKSNCVVYYFEAIIGDKSIIGVCREIEEAKNLYEAAKEIGHKVALIDRHQSMNDVFRCSIGNFPKYSQAKIILKFAMELRLSLSKKTEKETDIFELRLPLIINPRYTPPEYEMDNVLHNITNDYEFHFTARISGTKTINEISSINHKLNVNYGNENKTCAEVVLESKYDGKKDFDIDISYIDMRKPTIIYEPGIANCEIFDKDKFGMFYVPDGAMVNFLPTFNANLKEIKQEIVFIVDRSGSMGGSKIENAKSCLLIFLKSLPLNCKFQIYGFGSSFNKAFNKSQLYCDQSIQVALNYQKNISADLGGTKLMSPLSDMYNSSLSRDYTRVSFLLTDGDIGNQDEVVKLVGKYNKTTKLFTVGIGDGVSTSLVDQVAKAGLGKSVFVRNSSDLSSRVMELLDLALTSDQFTDAEIHWKYPDHVSIVTIPKCIPTIFSNYFVTAFCMISGMKSDDIIECTLSGKVDGEHVSFPIEISNTNTIVDQEFRVHRLMAKYKIDEMTADIENGGSDLKKQLIDLSLQVNMVTNYTIFVAIDPEIPDKICHTNYENVIKAEMFRNVQGLNSSRFSHKKCRGFAISLPKFRWPKFNLFKTKKKSLDLKVEEKQNETDFYKNDSNDIIIYLVTRQNIDGSWKYEKSVLIRLGFKIEDIDTYKPEPITNDCWITVIIYQYLVIEQQSKETEWRLIARKAMKWIEEMLNNSTLLKEVLDSSLKLIKLLQ